MEHNGSSPHSQEPATCPYPEPDQSSPYPPIPLLEDQIILPSSLGLRLPSCLFPSGHATKTLYAPVLSPYVLGATLISFFLIWLAE